MKKLNNDIGRIMSFTEDLSQAVVTKCHNFLTIFLAIL